MAAIQQPPHSFKNYQFYIIGRQKVGLFCSLLYSFLINENLAEEPTYFQCQTISHIHTCTLYFIHWVCTWILNSTVKYIYKLNFKFIREEIIWSFMFIQVYLSWFGFGSCTWTNWSCNKCHDQCLSWRLQDSLFPCIFITKILS